MAVLVQKTQNYRHDVTLTIIDVKQNQEIAFSMRYIACGGLLFTPYSYDYHTGDVNAAYTLDERVLFDEYAYVPSTFKNNRNYLKHILRNRNKGKR